MLQGKARWPLLEGLMGAESFGRPAAAKEACANRCTGVCSHSFLPPAPLSSQPTGSPASPFFLLLRRAYWRATWTCMPPPPPTGGSHPGGPTAPACTPRRPPSSAPALATSTGWAGAPCAAPAGTGGIVGLVAQYARAWPGAGSRICPIASRRASPGRAGSSLLAACNLWLGNL
jgi:hypothetical protein